MRPQISLTRQSDPRARRSASWHQLSLGIHLLKRSLDRLCRHSRGRGPVRRDALSATLTSRRQAGAAHHLPRRRCCVALFSFCSFLGGVRRRSGSGGTRPWRRALRKGMTPTPEVWYYGIATSTPFPPRSLIA